jgi:hypothetical protein
VPSVPGFLRVMAAPSFVCHRAKAYSKDLICRSLLPIEFEKLTFRLTVRISTNTLEQNELQIWQTPC